MRTRRNRMLSAVVVREKRHRKRMSREVFQMWPVREKRIVALDRQNRRQRETTIVEGNIRGNVCKKLRS